MNTAARRNRLLDRWGWYEPRVRPMHSTTRQADVLNLALLAPPTTHRGLIVGIDQPAGQVVCHDPFTACEDQLVASPDVVVVGDAGTGKSSLLKTWGTIRQLVLDRRRVVVLDPRGEYARVTAAVGAPSIRFTVDGTGARLNLLDPAIHPAAESGMDKSTTSGGPVALLRTILAEALGREANERESRALRLALAAATADARDRRRAPVIGDVVHHLINPAAGAAKQSHVPVTALRDWGLEPAFALERLTGDVLAGVVDGETTPNVRLDHPSGLTHVDLSGLPPGGLAARLVTSLITTWQRHRFAGFEQTVTIVENGRHAGIHEGDEPAGGSAVATFTVFRHACDLLAAPPPLRAAPTVFLYRQARRADAQACVDLYDLPPTAVETITSLERGTCLLKIGSDPPIVVRHVRARDEVWLTESGDCLPVVGPPPWPVREPGMSFPVDGIDLSR